jgi:SAM-dependent methyltransferase
MTSARTESVREFWESRASASTATDEQVTHPDVWQRQLEIETLRQLLEPTDRVLDVGCGNGYTTRRLAQLVREMVGIDYSDAMIDRARKESEGLATFWVKNVLELGPADFGLFDVVITERCLINLDSWATQQQALANIATVLPAGGRLLFVEGCRQGRERLDALRAQVGLATMPRVWHNIDFDEDATLAYLSESFEVERRLHFGVYDFVSRIVHPLMVAPAEPRYDTAINAVGSRLALTLDAFPELSRVLFLVLRKRAPR